MTEIEHSSDIDDMLGAWEGDLKALIRELLEERQQLLRQLELCAAAMSLGYVRGWKPNLPDC